MGNSYRLSSGEYIKKSVIDARVRKAKGQIINNQLEEYGYNFCEHCGASTGVMLDCSHNISIKEAQETGRSELCYDINNLTILCRECHSKKDTNILKFKSNEK